MLCKKIEWSPVHTNPFSNENGLFFFCSGYGYRPHYNAENDHRKWSHSKTLSRVERFENDAFRKRCFLVWTVKTMLSEKRWRHQNRQDQAPDHSTVSIQNGGQTLPCGFNFVGRYIEMHMRRVHLSMRTDGIKAFSKWIRRCSVDGRKQYENDKCERKSFWKWSKTAPFSFENGLVWTGPESTAQLWSLYEFMTERGKCSKRIRR